jgi:hypothetical protein
MKAGWYITNHWHRGELRKWGPQLIKGHLTHALDPGPYPKEVGNSWHTRVRWWKYRVAWKYYRLKMKGRLVALWNSANRAVEQPLLKPVYAAIAGAVLGYLFAKGMCQ